MILVKPSHEILQISENPLQLIELAGRTCYKSEDKITKKSAERFVKMITRAGHHSVIEHAFVTVKIICDRGVSHEIVRHRLASYSQESTRYCNYKGGVTFVIPPWCKELKEVEYPCGELKEDYLYYVPSLVKDFREFEEIEYSDIPSTLDLSTKNIKDLSTKNIKDLPTKKWLESMWRAEDTYIRLLHRGWSPQQARSVLPNSLKTEIVITANVREWRHIFTLRCHKASHPQMNEIMRPLHQKMKLFIPIIFDDIEY